MNSAQFKYHCQETEKLKEELLLLMEKNQKRSFRIPAKKSKDNKEHVFHFDIKHELGTNLYIDKGNY